MVELPLKEEPILTITTPGRTVAEAMEAETTVAGVEDTEAEATEETAGLNVAIPPLHRAAVVGATLTPSPSEARSPREGQWEEEEDRTEADAVVAGDTEVVALETAVHVSTSADFMVI